VQSIWKARHIGYVAASDNGKIWLNQQQMAELFATSKPNISMHIANILKERELYKDSVVKEFLTTAADGKNYNVVFYTKRRTRPHSACRERHTLEESPCCVKIKGAAAPRFLFQLKNLKALSHERLTLLI
jgi:hypothetical protein